MGMRESHTAADKKGSLTSEDLVSSLSAVMCDFTTALPFASAADLAAADAPPKPSGATAGAAKKSNAKDMMTPGQRVFYHKIIKPRRPGTCVAPCFLHFCASCSVTASIRLPSAIADACNSKCVPPADSLTCVAWDGCAGIQEMMEMMRGMPASITASPLRERQRASLNLPSAAVLGSGLEHLASNVVSISVTIAGM